MINKKLLLLSLSNENNWDFDKNIYTPLKNIFSCVVRYNDYRKRLYDIGIITLQKEIINLVRKEHPDYVLIPASSNEILKETFNAIHEEGCLILGWFFDDRIRFDNYSKYFIPYIDYFLTSDKTSVSKYNRFGAKSNYVASASNPEMYIRKSFKSKFEVSFVGRNISNRKEFIDEIRNNDIQVNTFGFSSNRIVSFEKMINIFSQSKINLNFTGSYCNPKTKQLKARIFEITMCGGFLLTEYVEGLEKYFDIGKEIDCFYTKNGAIEKIKYYLANDQKRQIIADAGYKKSQDYHTWDARLLKIFNIIEKDVNDKNHTPSKVSTEPLNGMKILESNYLYLLFKKWKSINETEFSKEAIFLSYQKDNKNFKKAILSLTTILPSKIYIYITDLMEGLIDFVRIVRTKVGELLCK